MPAAKKLTYDYYGLPIYETEDRHEYAVGTDAQATKAAREYILDSLWAFRTEFIVSAAKLDDKAIKSIRDMQEKMSEDANPLIRRLIGEQNLSRFVREAISADGRGHFLASYDGHEQRSNDIEGLPRGKIAFRIQ